jgi:hypothetical protein
MKRNSLTTAVVAGIAGVAGFAGLANAVDLNPDGVGQVLIYPYFTVNKSQDTLLSVVNTADVGKAVKVRFLEGYNSREVLDFNLFLSPHDVWTGAVTQVSADGGAQLITSDHSCTDTISNPQPFLPYAYDGSLAPAQPADNGPQDITRTREGYVEIITMGDIIPGSDLDAVTTHNQTGTPDAGTPDCGAPVGNDTATAADLQTPTSGLFGGGAIANVGSGTYFAYNADAIEGFYDNPTGNLYTPAGSLLPSLQSASNAAVPGGAQAFLFLNNGQLLTANYARGIDAVSAVFMADAVYNEYFVDDVNFGAASDWVLTFPTKRFYVDKYVYPFAVTAPFVEPFDNTADGESRVNLAIVTYDREELNSVVNVPRCPSPVNPVTCFSQSPFLGHEVNVLSFLGPDTATPSESTVLGSNLFKTVNAVGLDGWSNLDLYSGDGGHVLAGGLLAGGGAVNLNGLPVTGFYAMNVINTNANPGMLANYSGVWRHRTHRSCSANGADPACS